MKEKRIQIRVDDELMAKIDVLSNINDYKNTSDAIRKVIEKEYRREVMSIRETYEKVLNKVSNKEFTVNEAMAVFDYLRETRDHGEWIDREGDYPKYYTLKCSACKNKVWYAQREPFDFCPCCGADMRGEIR